MDRWLFYGLLTIQFGFCEKRSGELFYKVLQVGFIERSLNTTLIVLVLKKRVLNTKKISDELIWWGDHTSIYLKS